MKDNSYKDLFNFDKFLPKCPIALTMLKIKAYKKILKDAKKYKVPKKHIKRYKSTIKDLKLELNDLILTKALKRLRDK